MTKRLLILIAATAGALAVPFIAQANEPSHNVCGEQGIVFHDARGDARAAPRSEQPVSSAWRYVGGEAVWIYEGRGNRSMQERSGQTDFARVPRASERPPMQQTRITNDVYHGA